MKILKKHELFIPLLLLGVLDGLILSNISDWVFLSFWEHSLTHGISVLIVFLGVFLVSWSLSKLIKDTKTTTKIRIIFLGISVTALLNSVFNLARFAHEGIPFHSLLWSLFVGSLFVTIERLIKVWEEL